MFDPVGRLIAGKYRVTQRLGGGGVADVYEAVHEEIGQRFAIKILKPEFAAFPEVAERFLVEARAAAAVRHPGVVKIFDFGRLDEGMPYLVMELLDGESLADLLERKRRLPQEQAIALCLHVLDALEAAHRAGVVHRDLKPENVVLVRGPGGEPWAKLIDFGIALLGRIGPAAIRQTVQGTVMGTPFYMAPEQARGALDIDGRADLYALGVMLFEMLVGKLPFTGRTPAEVLTRVLTEPFPSARAADDSIPAALDDVILRATARKREQRFASAAEFAEALRPLRPEMVAVEFVADDEAGRDAEGTAVRRLAELARRSESGRASGMTPPRLSAPPPL
ncbi:MAG: serine/threonine protein kinase, partial [Myxococcales bacterium]|nr:serine/threonine protein kinase [Myxococcales bacterium]